ncbi:MAG: hypothetical protein NTX03_09600 [Bacteroidetes bacterium]|nr:hypothetical protein [Bacteroidota bacterium]
MEHSTDQTGAWTDKLLDYRTTDENGNFAFSFSPKNNSDYYLNVDAKYYGFLTAAYSVNGNEKNENLKIRIRPNGHIRISIKNEIPKDTASISISSYSYGIPNLFRDTIIFGKEEGNKSSKITWWVNKKTNTIKQDTTMYIKELDTIDFTIKY